MTADFFIHMMAGEGDLSSGKRLVTQIWSQDKQSQKFENDKAE